jgi:hypothetical protein
MKFENEKPQEQAEQVCRVQVIFKSGVAVEIEKPYLLFVETVKHLGANSQLMVSGEGVTLLYALPGEWSGYTIDTRSVSA